MSMPKSVVRSFANGGVKYTSNVDRVNYTIFELSRRAMFDVGKYCNKILRKKVKELFIRGKTQNIKNPERKQHGIERAKKTKKHLTCCGFEVPKGQCFMNIGLRHETWYGVQQEYGTKNQPRRRFAWHSVYDNIDKIREIEAQYLSAVEDEIKAQSLINEGFYKDDLNDE